MLRVSWDGTIQRINADGSIDQIEGHVEFEGVTPIILGNYTVSTKVGGNSQDVSINYLKLETDLCSMFTIGNFKYPINDFVTFDKYGSRILKIRVKEPLRPTKTFVLKFCCSDTRDVFKYACSLHHLNLDKFTSELKVCRDHYSNHRH